MSVTTIRDQYEAVIGLEIHVQLATRTKIFCGCSTRFGAGANSQVCPVCLGHPGVLPVLNRQAVEFALRFGLAVSATIGRRSVFARKNYFYPDLPKGYQISQYELPIIVGGEVPFRLDGEERRVQLTRAHLEEDAGKSMHPQVGRENVSLVDLNRSGIPLLEVVTEPDLRSPDEAHAFLERMRQLVVYLGICDGNMEEGSLRCDANVSLRARGATHLNPKTEIKNLNSFRNVERSLRYEIVRQAHVLEDGEELVQATRLWDEREGRTRIMRVKEDADDYRYFPDPDLAPVVIDDAWLESVGSDLREAPWDRERRFETGYGLSPQDAHVLAADPGVAEYFEAAASVSGEGKLAANWVMTDVLRLVKETPGGVSRLAVAPEALGEMIGMIIAGEISGRIAKDVFEIMAAGGGSPREIVDARGWGVLRDSDALAEHARAAVDANPGPLKQYLDGKATLLQFFVGQVMRATRGQADPLAVREAVEVELRRRGEGEKP